MISRMMTSQPMAAMIVLLTMPGAGGGDGVRIFAMVGGQ
jgi:hypothetical protein